MYRNAVFLVVHRRFLASKPDPLLSCLVFTIMLIS
jgi:hypothetical protein